MAITAVVLRAFFSPNNDVSIGVFVISNKELDRVNVVPFLLDLISDSCTSALLPVPYVMYDSLGRLGRSSTIFGSSIQTTSCRSTMSDCNDCNAYVLKAFLVSSNVS